jgi:hypothetical protein
VGATSASHTGPPAPTGGRKRLAMLPRDKTKFLYVAGIAETVYLVPLLNRARKLNGCVVLRIPGVLRSRRNTRWCS